MANSKSWEKICTDLKILNHDFNNGPFKITAKDIKTSCQNFTKTNEKEVRILCKQDKRENRPQIFQDNDLFILPIKNGEYCIVKGEGYFDIPEIESEILYDSKLNFELVSSKIGNSEMQHLDFAYASSIIRTFMNDDSLVLTIRGRKYTPEFKFRVNGQEIMVKGVQTEVDAGYEGKEQIVLVEAKSASSRNSIIRQLYYPYKKWSIETNKKISLLFFEKNESHYNIWEYKFRNEDDYNSIYLVKSERYRLK